MKPITLLFAVISAVCFCAGTGQAEDNSFRRVAVPGEDSPKPVYSYLPKSAFARAGLETEQTRWTPISYIKKADDGWTYQFWCRINPADRFAFPGKAVVSVHYSHGGLVSQTDVEMSEPIREAGTMPSARNNTVHSVSVTPDTIPVEFRQRKMSIRKLRP